MANKRITKEDLIKFEKDIFDTYSIGKIKAPVHLTGSIGGEQEDALVKIFKKIKKNDWVFSTHRSHYHALLKSQNPKWLREEIIKGRSSHINSKKYKIFTSAIVGGNLPIAVGTALALKRKRSKNKVWCFVGDMASQMGIFNECVKYAEGMKLPITFIIENNKLGCYTPTEKVWKIRTLPATDNYIKYDYKRKYPHYGVGKWITF